MNPLWTQIVLRTIYSKKGGQDIADPQQSGYLLAKGFRQFRAMAFRSAKDFLLITLGIFSAAFGFKGFLLTNRFIDGGATGISLLISSLSDIPLYILLLCVNAPFLLLGYKVVGKGFAIKASLAISGLALVVATVSFPDVTSDNLLVAVFGGFFLGAGIGLAVRGGAVIDGTEVMAVWLSRKLGTSIGNIILMINIVIFSVAAYLLSVEIAMYSIITYLAASRTVDFIIEGIEEYTGVTIISPHSETIRQMIIEKMGRGVTIYKGKRGYGKQGDTGMTREVDIIYTVVTRLELNRLNTEVARIDPNAFVVMNTINDIKGGIIKKRPLK